MDSMTIHRKIVQSTLTDYTMIPYAHGRIQNVTVFDEPADRYLLMVVGWDRRRRIHGCLVHIDLIDGKVWIQHDSTEQGVALDLERAGIPKDHIVLAFHPADVRPHTGYAVA
jgi:hypothetical protein